MSVRKGTRLAKKLRWIIFRVALLLVVALFGLSISARINRT